MRTFILAGLPLVLAAAPALGFVVNYNAAQRPLKWNLEFADPLVPTNSVNPNTKAIRYFLGAAGWSSTNRAAELDAVRASFNQWEAIPGVAVRFEEAGVLSGPLDVNTVDGTNVVFWARQSTIVNGGLDSIAGRLALTFVDFLDADHFLVEADMAINGVEFAWFTDITARGLSDRHYFVEGVVAHEVGHWLGLDHSPLGGATMMWRGISGVGLQAGLAVDDMAAARFLYPAQGLALATIRGRVTLGGQPVHGAVVVAEDAAGNAVNGTVSRADGAYELGALAAGQYRVRATPLDPFGTGNFLIRGREIGSDYEQANTSFRASTERAVTVGQGAAVTADLGVEAGRAPFRIIYMREPSADATAYDYYSAPVALAPGAGRVFAGVLSPDLPSEGAVLTVSGGGLEVGPTFFGRSRFGEQGVFVPIEVLPGAAPGLRSFKLTRGSDVVYANGFLEISPPFPDFNFDGLDDLFQRRYFSPFTAAAARPGADPDGDGFTNAQEHVAGSVPTDRNSVRFKIESVRLTSQGSVVRWQSAPGKRFQLYGRDDVAGSVWERVGGLVTGGAGSAEQTDVRATNRFRFYRVELLP